MGLELAVPEGVDESPEGVDENMVRAIALADYILEIGAGLGAMAGKVWRIGLIPVQVSAPCRAHQTKTRL